MGERRKRWVRRLLPLAGTPLLILLCAIGWNQATYNFGALQAGHIYRSGQMPASALARTMRTYGIRTVLNLRGPNPNAPNHWYRDEVDATLKAGATHVDIALSSCNWMSRVQLRALIGTLDRCEYPLLIHCAWGSERTGMVSAFAELLRPGSTLADARAQFSLRHLFVRLGDGRIMAEAVDQYENWLARQHMTHTPEAFRRWVFEGYRPGSPSREEWPYDPYPLVVITRPEPVTAAIVEKQPGPR